MRGIGVYRPIQRKNFELRGRPLHSMSGCKDNQEG